LSALDQRLLAAKLADLKSLKPMASPFLQYSFANFAGIVIALGLGIAALPSLFGRHLSQSSVAAGEAARRTSLALVFVVVFLLGVAAFAVMARFAFETFMAGGIEAAVVPAGLVEASRLGWLDICGVNSAVASDITAACAKVSGHRGFLRLQDISFSSDGFIFAAPWLSKLPAAAYNALYGGALVAALAMGHAILASLLAADDETRSVEAIAEPSLDVRSIVIAMGLLLAVLFVAMFGSSQMPALAAEGLALIASGLFPALVLGLYWRRMNGTAAIVAMIAGVAVCGIYIAGVHLFPVLMFDWTGGHSNAAPGAVRKFADLRAAVGAATADDMRASARAALSAHAASIANWWGLIPAASVLFAVPAGFLAGAATVLFRTRRLSGESSDPQA
jgi:Na+(H+)/acetate symporter ActP